jgi:hypothetical protein
VEQSQANINEVLWLMMVCAVTIGSYLGMGLGNIIKINKQGDRLLLCSCSLYMVGLPMMPHLS